MPPHLYKHLHIADPLTKTTPSATPLSCIPRRDDNHTYATLRAGGCCPAAVIFTELCLGGGVISPVSARKYIKNEIKMCAPSPPTHANTTGRPVHLCLSAFIGGYLHTSPFTKKM